MRILIVHNSYQIRGGEDSVVAAEIELLRQNGHLVDVLCMSNDEIKAYGMWQKAMLFGRTIFSFKSYRLIDRMIREKRPDIVHFHNLFPLVSPSGYYAAKKHHVPVVQTLHNYRLLCANALLARNGQICEQCLETSFLPALVHSCYRGSRLGTLAVILMVRINRLLKTWSTQVDKYVVLTNFAKQKFKSLGIAEEKLIVKPNFSERPAIEPKAEAAGKYITFVGRLSEEKGLDILLQAWDIVSTEMAQQGIELLIAGDGPLRDRLEERARELGNINIAGRKTKDEVFAILAESRCLVLPSVCYEGFPVTLVEAFSMGVPVIGSGIGGIGEIIKTEENGLLFEPGNAKDLAAKLLYFVRSGAVSGITAVGALKDYNEFYCPEVGYEQLIGIYTTAIPERRQQAMQGEGE